MVRVQDVARIELGAQTYSMQGRLDGGPSAVIAIYQSPGSNAIDAFRGAKKLMDEAKTRFPQDMDYTVSLDTTLAVTEGIKEIVQRRSGRRSSSSSSSSSSFSKAGARR